MKRELSCVKVTSIYLYRKWPQCTNHACMYIQNHWLGRCMFHRSDTGDWHTRQRLKEITSSTTNREIRSAAYQWETTTLAKQITNTHTSTCVCVCQCARMWLWFVYVWRLMFMSLFVSVRVHSQSLSHNTHDTTFISVFSHLHVPVSQCVPT